MQKYISLLLILWVLPVVASVQDNVAFRRNEVSIYVGTLFDIKDIYSSGTSDHYSPSLSLGYMRRLTRVWAVGATLSYVRAREESTLFFPSEQGTEGESYLMFDDYHISVCGKQEGRPASA